MGPISQSLYLPPAFSSESRGAIVCGLQAVWLLQNVLGVLIIISVLICYPCNHVHSESVVAFEPHSLSRMLSTLVVGHHI